MPVVIHGGGTIEGIAVGGLPDGLVDSDMMASGNNTGLRSQQVFTTVGTATWTKPTGINVVRVIVTAGARGGGGYGAAQNNNGNNGTANLGGGGGGGSGDDASYVCGNGGSGIVILRYLTADVSSYSQSGLTITASTTGSYSVLQITAGTGTITFS